jgi:hypothetical protein
MFCPECKAEYRQGFTRCADCEVDLVETEQDARRSRRAADEAVSGDLAVQVWHGADPHFYLGVLEYLAVARGMPCSGRPVNPPEYESFEQQPTGSFSPPEFEIRVLKENFALAKWMLDSWKEKYDESKAEEEQIARGTLEEFPEYEEQADEQAANQEVQPEGECPLCGEDFHARLQTCPDCEVRLRTETEKKDGTNSGRLLCNLPHPDFYGELRNALLRAGIPFNCRAYQDGSIRKSLDLVVLEVDFKRATELMAQLLQYREFGEGLARSSQPDPRDSYWTKQAGERGWYPEDLTVLAWQGKNFITLNAVGMTLREHRISYRVESPEPGSAKVLVHAEDEPEAREVLKDIVREPVSG